MCHEQNWLVYHPVLVMEIMVGISPSFFCRGQKLVGISTGFVGRGQYWVVHFTDVSYLDNIGW